MLRSIVRVLRVKVMIDKMEGRVHLATRMVFSLKVRVLGSRVRTHHAVVRMHHAIVRILA
jgi:hypothetical protein